MFEESLVESTGVLGRRSRWSAVISFGTQAVVIAALLAIPILRPEALSVRAPQLTFVAPPPKPPQPPPPPPQRVHVDTAMEHTLQAPSAPAENAPRVQTSLFRPSTDMPDTPGTTTISMVGNGPPLPFAVGPNPGGSNPNVVRAAPVPAAIQHISSGVSAGLLLAPIQPIYPAIAKAAHLEGTVIIQAVISKSGHIETAHVVSGPAMLQGSALEAVRSARYRPYLLNKEPTEVETTISISFHMNS